MQKKKTKQKVWTKKCANGDKCISGHIIAPIPDLRESKKIDEWSRGPREPAFIPDEHELCEPCLLAELKLEETTPYCDPEGMGPKVYSEDDVIPLLRRLTGK